MNNSCPICGSRNIIIFLRRQDVPAHQNLPLNNQSEAIHSPKGTLEMSLCQDCKFIFNSQFDEENMEYTQKYNNNQFFSPSFRQYVDDIINYLILKRKIGNSTILEIGCGKGDFIRDLISKGYGNRGIGFDPSYIGSEEMFDGNLRYIKDFFDSRYNNISADVVICRHVIEHISSPLKFLRNLKESLQNTNTVNVFFETPCVEWILKNNVFWDFFYEHCSYFTSDSLTNVFELAGFKVQDVKHIFNGQYLWLEATLNRGESKTISDSNLLDLVNQYNENETNIIKRWSEKLELLENVAVWGAGAKGVTFVNLLDPQRKLINCVVDINPDKQGKFIPGTGHPIINHTQLLDRNITSIIVMNPNYMDEIRKLISGFEIRIQLLGVE